MYVISWLNSWTVLFCVKYILVIQNKCIAMLLKYLYLSKGEKKDLNVFYIICTSEDQSGGRQKVMGIGGVG